MSRAVPSTPPAVDPAIAGEVTVNAPRSASSQATHRTELYATAIAHIDFGALGFRIEGISVAGVETWLRIPQWSLGIDVGRSPEHVVRCRHLALTHAHMDHAGGLPHYLALRRLYGLGPSTVYAPAPTCADLNAVVQAWQRLHGHDFDWQLVPMEPGSQADLGGGRYLRAFAVAHVVPALGYAVLERRPKLLGQFVGQPQELLRELARRGVETTVPTERILLAASGDSLVSVLESAAELRGAEVTLCETTFLDPRRSVAEAHAGGHIHLDELIERAELLTCRHFVPYHISQIYSAREACDLLAARLPPELARRTQPLLPSDSRRPVSGVLPTTP